MSAFSSIYIPFLVKSVLCVFLECFKCEITDTLRCLGISNGPVEHSKSTEIQTFSRALPLTPARGSEHPMEPSSIFHLQGSWNLTGFIS